MKASILFTRLLAPAVLGVMSVVTAWPASAAEAEKTLAVFSFQNATAGVGGNLGDRVVAASYLRESAQTSATFSWTDPDGLFPNAGGTFYDHGVQQWDWDGPGDKVFSARGTGPAWDFSQGGFGSSHFVITLTAKKPWLLTDFSMQQQANDPQYPVDIVAVQGNASTVLGTVWVGGSGFGIVNLSGLSHIFAAGPAQILILPQVPSPTGSGYLAVDDVTLTGKWNP